MRVVILLSLAFGLAAAVPRPTDQAPAPGRPAPSSGVPASPTFAEDVAFLQRHTSVRVLVASSGARVAVSATYQGRVMTSAVAADGASLGWIKRAFISAGKTGTPFDNYGGEDRFWLGPEGGQYGLYFPAGKPFVFSEWKTPAALQEGAWEVKEA